MGEGDGFHIMLLFSSGGFLFLLEGRDIFFFSDGGYLISGAIYWDDIFFISVRWSFLLLQSIYEAFRFFSGGSLAFGIVFEKAGCFDVFSTLHDMFYAFQGRIFHIILGGEFLIFTFIILFCMRDVVRFPWGKIYVSPPICFFIYENLEHCRISGHNPVYF